MSGAEIRLAVLGWLWVAAMFLAVLLFLAGGAAVVYGTWHSVLRSECLVMR